MEKPNHLLDSVGAFVKENPNEILKFTLTLALAAGSLVAIHEAKLFDQRRYESKPGRIDQAASIIAKRYNYEDGCKINSVELVDKAQSVKDDGKDHLAIKVDLKPSRVADDLTATYSKLFKTHFAVAGGNSVEHEMNGARLNYHSSLQLFRAENDPTLPAKLSEKWGGKRSVSRTRELHSESNEAIVRTPIENRNHQLAVYVTTRAITYKATFDGQTHFLERQAEVTGNADCGTIQYTGTTYEKVKNPPQLDSWVYRDKSI